MIMMIGERMTERFTEIVSLEKIKDNQTGKTYIGIVDSSFIGLVNGIVEEQEYLVFKSKQQRESIRVLLKENEQLKHEIEDFQTLLASKEEVYLKPVLRMIDEKMEQCVLFGDTKSAVVLSDLKQELKGDVE